MRYIADSNGYLLEVSFGAIIQCNGKDCTEYTGDVPSGYDDLVDWFIKEGDKLYRWKVHAGQLTLDSSVPVKSEPGEVFAPAGFGLGRSAVYIQSSDNLNNYKVGGWYQFTKGVANAPFNYGMMLIIHGTDYNNETFQYAFSRYPANNMAIRQLFDGSWGEWEWINPPMVVGTEYRTTERWQGSVVYTTLVNFGNMPNNSTASVSIANLKSTGILSCHGVTNKGDSIPYSWSGEYMMEVSATVNNIYLYTRVNASDSIAYITLKYIKG